MKAFLRTLNDADLIKLECKEIIVREGATIKMDGVDQTFLVVIASDGIYHPVVDVEVV